MPFPNHPGKHDAPTYLTPESIADTSVNTDTAIPESVILCYQPDFFEHVVETYAGAAIDLFTESARLYHLSETDGRVGVLGAFGIGAPATAVCMERLIAHGTDTFCIVGGCGGLGRNVTRLKPVVCDRAIRDEGVSHHYLPSDTYISASTSLVDQLEASLDTAGFEYKTGPSWTIDALFRETIPEIKRYRDEGVLTVEMEAAAVFAIAEYRGVDAAALFCPFDLVMADGWESKQEPTVDGLRDLLVPARNALVSYSG